MSGTPARFGCYADGLLSGKEQETGSRPCYLESMVVLTILGTSSRWIILGTSRRGVSLILFFIWFVMLLFGRTIPRGLFPLWENYSWPKVS